MSVTQAALAIVGAIIGSSALSVLTFYLIIRYRRQRSQEREAEFRREISYPKTEAAMSDSSSVYQADATNPRTPPVGYATSTPAPKPTQAFEASPHVQNLASREQRQSNYSVFPRPREESGSGALEKVDEEEARKVSGELMGWLRSTRTISPFGNVVDNPDEARGPNWPFDKNGPAKSKDESRS